MYVYVYVYDHVCGSPNVLGVKEQHKMWVVRRLGVCVYSIVCLCEVEEEGDEEHEKEEFITCSDI